MSHSKALCYEFGPFRFNVALRLLTRDGAVISLGPKAAEILLTLVRNAGEIVGKEHLMKEVWPDSFVEEANLTQNIFTLRRALGDTRTDARFIETVARRGYRFVASVNLVEDSPQGGEAGELVLASPILAVLPFANGTGDDGLEYLAEGVCENIINSLSHISKLRVMSRSAVYRYKGRDIEPRIIHEDLGVDVLLLGKIISPPSGLRINAVLVNAATGWQLWGESFKCELNEILEIQDEIVRQISAALGVQLSGDEQRRITARYTENPNAYQAYIEGRFYWSQYTRSGIEKAIERFRKAIELDPNYALAYAGIVDCYLRLATNYLPPERASANEDVNPDNVNSDLDFNPGSKRPQSETVEILGDSDGRIKLRHEWDWKGAERELKRANELKADYPAAHQWHAVHRFVVRLLENPSSVTQDASDCDLLSSPIISRAVLSPNEEVQVLCTVAREQMEAGNYEAGCLVLKNWWRPNEWPRVESLSSQSAADLLFTAGSLAGCLSSTGQLKRGQKHAEALLSGAIALCELLGLKRRCAEGYVELALCYYRQGIFDLTRTTLLSALTDISPMDTELRSVALIRLAVSERHAGYLYDSLARLKEAREFVELGGALVTGRYHHELATTLKDVALAEGRSDYVDEVTAEFERALYEFDAIGHHRYTAVVENNFGFLLMNLKDFEGAKTRLCRARLILEKLGDKVRRAQVDDTLARLYVETTQLDFAEESSALAVSTLESGDEEALLAEALTTRGLVLCKLRRIREARSVLEGANRIAERCGDTEGAGRALLIIIEEIFESLGNEERLGVAAHINRLLGETQQNSIRVRLESCLQRIGTTGH